MRMCCVERHPVLQRLTHWDWWQWTCKKLLAGTHPISCIADRFNQRAPLEQHCDFVDGDPYQHLVRECGRQAHVASFTLVPSRSGVMRPYDHGICLDVSIQYLVAFSPSLD